MDRIQVYTEKAIYDDPWSYCDTRYKIAGQWYGSSPSLSLTFILPPLSSPRPSHPTHKSPGIPQIMSTSRTLATEIVSSTSSELIFKLRQEYKPILFPAAKAVNSLVSLTLVTETEDEKEVERVSYHKDMWNEKDYSHEGLGKVLKTLNGDYLTGVTRPPKSL